MYIEIDGVEYPCEVATSISQLGNTVIRVISDDAPVAEDGFILKNGEKEFDRSSFKYLYRADGNIKEYTEVEEEIIPASGYVSGIPDNPLAKQLSAMNQRIADLTPYEETKRAFYGEKEKTFHGVPSGNVTVFFDNYNGGYRIERIDDMVLVRFKEMIKDVTSVTIMVQK